MKIFQIYILFRLKKSLYILFSKKNKVLLKSNYEQDTIEDTEIQTPGVLTDVIDEVSGDQTTISIGPGEDGSTGSEPTNSVDNAPANTAGRGASIGGNLHNIKKATNNIGSTGEISAVNKPTGAVENTPANTDGCDASTQSNVVIRAGGQHSSTLPPVELEENDFFKQ